MGRPEHLFVASDGNMYDCRVSAWSKLPPLRSGFYGHAKRIETVAELKATLRAGKSTDLGGYPLYFICSDGAALSFDAVRENLALCISAIAARSNDGWRVVACEINYEDSYMVCAHTSKPIPSAYGDDSAEIERRIARD